MNMTSKQLLLTCYLLDDGEQHWVSAPTEKAAREVLTEKFGAEECDIETVTIVDPTSMLRVRTDDYVYGKFAPKTAHAYFEDTVFNWCKHTGTGLISSTVF